MLIDEISGSGGDAFPALLGGTGRATLLGSRTIGAGGHVTKDPSLPFSNISIRMTKSLFFRPDGVEVENNGAIPDIEYRPSISDHLNGFKDYQEFYLNALFEKL